MKLRSYRINKSLNFVLVSIAERCRDLDLSVKNFLFLLLDGLLDLIRNVLLEVLVVSETCAVFL